MSSYSIYPKQFVNSTQRLQSNTCFVIMPFSKELDNTYMVIDSVSTAMGIKCLRADNISTTSEPILNKICTQISQAFFVIVDITNLNPNVFYELGIAHVLRDAEKVLIIKETQTKCPSDITHLHYYSYSKDNLKELQNTLIHFFTENNVLADLSSVLKFLEILPENDALCSEFLESISSCIDTHLDILLELLSNKIERIQTDDITFILSRLTNEMIVCNQKIALQSSFEKLIFLIIRKAYEIVNISEFATQVWSGQYSKLSEEWIADFSIAVLDDSKYFSQAFMWIKNYLKTVSPAAFDIAKYKLEIGIIKSKATKIDTALIDELSSSDKTLAEHAAKLIKERNVKQAIPTLVKLVESDNNPYLVRSCIDALVKIAPLSTLYKARQILEDRLPFVNEHWFVQKHVSDLNSKIESLSN